MRAMRERLTAIFNAGVAAVAPDAAIREHMRLDPGPRLTIDGQSWALGKGRLAVVGAGKGAAPMARAVEKLLGKYISTGFVVVKDGHELALERLEIAAASHPVPNEAGAAAARRILQIAAALGPGDILLCVLTGGASALTPCPAPGLTLNDLQLATSLLLQSGAPITEINALRKHLSLFGGGQLARAANGATVIALLVSDVIGDDLAAIASGPTAPDPSTFADCLAIITRYGLAGRLPAPVMARLRAGAQGKIAETPKPGDPVFAHVSNFLLASNAQALAACASKARELGLLPVIVESPMLGEARAYAQELCARAVAIQESLSSGPVCLLAGGETTVAIKGRGRGGRNQEMALAFAICLQGHPGIGALFAGTDGTDGPTDAAGGFAFADTVSRLAKDASAFLADNDSYTALQGAGDLLITGPTLTNVMDLAIIIIEPHK